MYNIHIQQKKTRILIYLGISEINTTLYIIHYISYLRNVFELAVFIIIRVLNGRLESIFTTRSFTAANFYQFTSIFSKAKCNNQDDCMLNGLANKKNIACIMTKTHFKLN